MHSRRSFFGLDATRRMGLFILAGTLFGVFFWLPAATTAPLEEFTFRHDGILGTSLDVMVVAANADDAHRCESILLAEFERLRRVLSTYDATSEISRLNQTKAPQACSAELIEVLRGYERWRQSSDGAFNGQLGGLIEVWKEQAKLDRVPEAAVVDALVEKLRQPAWRINERAGTVQRLTDQPLNVIALGRGFILGTAARLAWQKVPHLRGLLVNHGGDMLALGSSANESGWRVGVADPVSHQENAPLLTTVDLRNRAIATSAAYERYFTVQGKHFSHIFDPRTGRPATGVASSTVIAPDNATANALATTLCVLKPDEGIKLVETVPGACCLLVTDDGQQLRSDGFERYECGQPVALQEKAQAKWAEGFEFNLTLNLVSPKVGKARRPYVAVWIENNDGKPIRTLAVWGSDPRWLKELYQWTKLHSNQPNLVKAVTRATRAAGKYTLAWDGLDDKGQAVDPATYTVQVEVHREHGKHVRQTGKIDCATVPATLTLAKTAETDETLVIFGPKGKEK